MEFQLSKLKSNFTNIKGIRNNTKNIFDILEVKINKLKLTHAELIKNNKTQIFIFGLDSFHFQSKLIDIEYDEMKRLFLAINNRMYCEYFKLYKLIVDYILQNINDKKVTEIIKLNNFPIYKDLEPFKEYKFEIILEIHENIIILISCIINNINKKENELQLYKSKKELGLSLDNFVNSFNFDIIMMREKVKLFLMYIDFFHKLHTKYLKRFSNKIQLMYTNIINDIKFDDSMNIDNNKSKDILDDTEKEQSNLKNIKIETNMINNKVFHNKVNDNKINSCLSSELDIDIQNYSNNEEIITPLSGNSTKSIDDVISLINKTNNKNIGEIEKSISDEDINIVLKNIEQTCEQMINNNTLDNNEKIIIAQNSESISLISENIVENKKSINNNDENHEIKENENENLLSKESLIESKETTESVQESIEDSMEDNITENNNLKKRRGRKKKDTTGLF